MVVAAALIAAGGTLNAADNYGSILLHCAAGMGNVEMVMGLLNAGAAVVAVARDGSCLWPPRRGSDADGDAPRGRHDSGGRPGAACATPGPSYAARADALWDHPHGRRRRSSIPTAAVVAAAGGEARRSRAWRGGLPHLGVVVGSPRPAASGAAAPNRARPLGAAAPTEAMGGGSSPPGRVRWHVFSLRAGATRGVPPLPRGAVCHAADGLCILCCDHPRSIPSSLAVSRPSHLPSSASPLI